MKLDQKNTYATLDKGHVAESIELLPEQILQVIKDAKNIKIPAHHKNITQIVVNGMGGSNLGAGIIKSVFDLKVPLSIAPGYSVPSHVNSKTLYIISSYSGTTEEPLSTYLEAKKRGAKIIAITANEEKNKLKDLMTKDKIPGLIFNANQNPSNQPRLGIGYSIFGMTLLLNKTGLLKIGQKEILAVVEFLKQQNNLLNIASPTPRNNAKQIAQKIQNKIPIIIGAEFAIGNIRALRNQLCESSKNYANYLTLPELNHYAMEGLVYPKSNTKNLSFLFFNSDLYNPRLQIRSKLTEDVVKKNKIQTVSYNLIGETKLTQSCEILQIGTWISYYLGILNKVDPVKIPWVDWFKKQLK